MVRKYSLLSLFILVREKNKKMRNRVWLINAHHHWAISFALILQQIFFSTQVMKMSYYKQISAEISTSKD